MRNKFIKLTGLGAVPKKTMVELYSHRFILEEHLESGIAELNREHDSISISTAITISLLAGLIKKQYGRYFLTRAGEKFLLPGNRLSLFKKVFMTFTDNFNWSENDLYPEDVAQMGWAYSIFLLNEYGEQRQKADFYSEKYTRAFPMLLNYFLKTSFAYATPEVMLSKCYAVRTFERFTEWFGLVKTYRLEPLRHLPTYEVVRTDLLKKVFVLE